jgi:hypothetical protein
VDANHCGTCGNVCPGTGSTTNVACQNGTCTLSCKGENYDVNGNPADGCEQESTFTAHTSATASNLGTHSCTDSVGGGFSGTFLSDARGHEGPDIPGFDPSVGAAPHWFVAFGSGGLFCQNDPALSLTMTGGTSGCYEMSIITDKGTHNATVIDGAASIVLPASSYNDGTNIYFLVKKTCGTNAREAAAYSATYHL